MPDSLKNLVPEYMDSIPIDPFDGKPLKYRKGDIEKVRFVKKKPKKDKKEKFSTTLIGLLKSTSYGGGPEGMEELTIKYPGYIIYSVGWKGKDDGGTPDKPGGRKSDITFTVIRKN